MQLGAQAEGRWPLLEPGQRAPNFALANAEGQREQLYDRFIGNRMLLVMVPRPELQAELRDFADAREAVAAAGAAVAAVCRGGLTAEAAPLAQDGLALYADPQGELSLRFGIDPGPQAACITYVLDRNQRVLAVFSDADGQAAAALAYLRGLAPDTAESRKVSAQAPVLLVPRVLSPALCQEAIAAWQSGHDEGLVNMPERAYEEASAAKPVHQVYLGLKKRRDHITDDRLNGIIIQTVMRNLAPELFKATRFRIGGLERICIGAYEAGRGDYFRAHRDNMTETTRERCFAVSIALNDDYQGGGVRFAEFGEDVYDPPAGGALVFSCSLLHEALPVTAGTRFAAFTFLFGPGHRADKPFPTG